MQVVPFPENPLLHVHRKDPSVLLHVASLEHGDEAHSFMSIIAINQNLNQNFSFEIIQENVTLKRYISAIQYIKTIFIPVQVVPFPENPLLHVH